MTLRLDEVIHADIKAFFGLEHAQELEPFATVTIDPIEWTAFAHPAYPGVYALRDKMYIFLVAEASPNFAEGRLAFIGSWARSKANLGESARLLRLQKQVVFGSLLDSAFGFQTISLPTIFVADYTHISSAVSPEQMKEGVAVTREAADISDMVRTIMYSSSMNFGERLIANITAYMPTRRFQMAKNAQNAVTLIQESIDSLRR